jgi:hypothetical protein
MLELAVAPEPPALQAPPPAVPAAPPAVTARARAEAPRGRRRPRDAFLYALLAGLVLAAWGFTRLELYGPKSNTAYWLGVGGGVAMLLLFSYPMRKHLRFMQKAGAAKYWFVAHMVLGVGGPLLILLHSSFRIGSLNAGVAFFAMVIVALSGVVGRFLYLRLHQNLSGVQLTLDQLNGVLDAENSGAARLRFAPLAMQRCRDFETWAAGQSARTLAAMVRTLLLLPWRRWRIEWACRAEVRRRLVVVAHAERWTRRQHQARLHAARRLVHDYLTAAQRVALFSAWTRLFSWWHVAHVPIVYLLVISAIAHVVAVHAY